MTGRPFLGQITENGLFLVFTSLVGDAAVLPAADRGGRRRRVDRRRGGDRDRCATCWSCRSAGPGCCVVKYLGVAVFAVVAAATVFLVGTVVGLVLFPHGPVDPALRQRHLGRLGAVARSVLVAAYVAVMLLGLAAIGLFISTLTEVPIGAMAATAVLVIAAQIADAVPQIAWLHPYLFTHYWLAFGDLLRQPIATHDISLGLLSQAAYIAIFGTLAWARFTTKDITS